MPFCCISNLIHDISYIDKPKDTEVIHSIEYCKNDTIKPIDKNLEKLRDPFIKYV